MRQSDRGPKFVDIDESAFPEMHIRGLESTKGHPWTVKHIDRDSGSVAFESFNVICNPAVYLDLFDATTANRKIKSGPNGF